LTYHLAC